MDPFNVAGVTAPQFDSLGSQLDTVVANTAQSPIEVTINNPFLLNDENKDTLADQIGDVLTERLRPGLFGL
jgi:hypothetical protein